jgi:hypothetical protein
VILWEMSDGAPAVVVNSFDQAFPEFAFDSRLPDGAYRALALGPADKRHRPGCHP